MTDTAWPTVMVTGHRPQHLNPATHAWVRAELTRLAVKLRDAHGMALGVTGMALGADLWWADSLHRAGVPFAAHIPFEQQPDPWKRTNPEAVNEWRRLRALAADEKVYGDLAGLAGEARKQMVAKLLHERNDGMLAASSAVVAVWRPSKRGGGTYSAVVKAYHRRLSVILVNSEVRATTMPSRSRLAQLLSLTP